MPDTIQKYIVSPQGWIRLWIGVLGVGLPMVLVYVCLINPPDDYHWYISGVAKLACQVLLFAMFFIFAAVSAYSILILRVVELDFTLKTVKRSARFCGSIVHKKTWKLSDFDHIELKHRSAGEDTDACQSDIGLRHRSGTLVWLRAFTSQNSKPSDAALSFVDALKKRTGLPCQEK